MDRVRAFAGAAILGGGLALAGCGASGQAREPRDPDEVTAEDVRGRYIARVQEMLRGQVAGVQVQDTPSGLIIRIRQATSFNTSVEPLFVVDGLPIQPGVTGALTGLNPADIASIRVLKNAADTAMYGARGANGVVLIQTKRPPPP